MTRRLASSSLWSNHAARSLSTEVSSTASTSPNTTVPIPDKLYSRVELQMKGIDPEVMKSYAYFAKTAAEHLDIEVGKQ